LDLRAHREVLVSLLSVISMVKHDGTPGRQPAGRKSCQKSIGGAAGV
jgi:hypothetical protein